MLSRPRPGIPGDISILVKPRLRRWEPERRRFHPKYLNQLSLCHTLEFSNSFIRLRLQRYGVKKEYVAKTQFLNRLLKIRNFWFQTFKFFAINSDFLDNLMSQPLILLFQIILVWNIKIIGIRKFVAKTQCLLIFIKNQIFHAPIDKFGQK